MSIKVLALFLVDTSGYIWEQCVSVDLKHFRPSHCLWGEAQNPCPAFLSSLAPTPPLSSVVAPELKPGALVYSLRIITQGAFFPFPSVHWLVSSTGLTLRGDSPPSIWLGRQGCPATWRSPAVVGFSEGSSTRVTSLVILESSLPMFSLQISLLHQSTS